MITQLTKCLLATLLSLGLAACGLTGPLYMPPPSSPRPRVHRKHRRLRPPRLPQRPRRNNLGRNRPLGSL
ncbi:MULTISPECIES: LPS translocon maturation chaperone LptM [Aeromonas]|uniref:LPS translocon maturation chaperone LptM n=1 Tax=Aeromonas TaxID=642 RepID=UPI001F53425C|nr:MULTISPECIES: lipoprotein [Aeromonas]UUT50174.1 lipoprotein [Aeromonas hydrophila]